MSEVTLRIGGKNYVVACADGQEAQLARLGNMIDRKFADMADNRAPTEAQNLLFAALLLADELSEARDAMGDDPAALANRLETLAEEAEASQRAKREIALELDAVRAERDAIANELANIKSAAAGQEPLFGDGPRLAPRLEQLADLIEKCADTLERRVAAS